MLLAALIATSTFVGLKLPQCTSVPSHYAEIALLFISLIATVVTHRRLRLSLKNRFHAMYETHRVRLNLICLGLIIATGSLLTLYTVMEFSILNVTGYELITGHFLGAVLPILAYVFLIDASEDCFDCFNRSKDLTSGAQALSMFQIVEEAVGKDE